MSAVLLDPPRGAFGNPRRLPSKRQQAGADQGFHLRRPASQQSLGLAPGLEGYVIGPAGEPAIAQPGWQLVEIRQRLQALRPETIQPALGILRVAPQAAQGGEFQIIPARRQRPLDDFPGRRMQRGAGINLLI